MFHACPNTFGLQTERKQNIHAVVKIFLLFLNFEEKKSSYKQGSRSARLSPQSMIILQVHVKQCDRNIPVEEAVR